MPRQFRVPAGTGYPATAADFKLAKEGKPYKQTVQPTERVLEVPYPELAASFAAQGFAEDAGRGKGKEVTDDGVPLG